MEQRLYEPIRHVFTDEEIRVLGEALARETHALYELRIQKSGAVASINASLKNSEKLIGELTTKITNRYEIVDVEVIPMMDTPRAGMKALLRVDNNEVVRYEEMTAAEKQTSFGFNFVDPDEPDGKSKGAGE
jgi:hypothetical protein